MKLAVQCYTVRDKMENDLWGTLAAIRGLGLSYIEGGGTFGLPADEFKKGLDKLELKVSGNHASLDQLENGFDQVVQDNKTLETKNVVLSSVSKDVYEKGWGTVAKRLDLIGARLKDAGFRFSYHNHAFEFAREAGQPGLEILYAESDPTLVNSQLDTYWVAFGGGDPVTWIKKMKGRAPTVHLKDGKVGGSDPDFLEVGQGDLDWNGILAACDESNVEFGAIEQDTSRRDTLESLKMSVEFLRGKGIAE
jgi:sugar phosphate isomerase/epimerase